VLGVHFRGQEYRVAPDHPLPPTRRQMIPRAEALVAKYSYEKVFIATEEQAYVDLFRSVFGSRIICTDAFRTYDTNGYTIYPRPNHKYQLGLDILRDTLLLARCNALLCSGSNVAEFAQFFNAGRYEVVSKIDNGLNSKNPRIASRLWFIKNRLPEWLGGSPPSSAWEVEKGGAGREYPVSLSRNCPLLPPYLASSAPRSTAGTSARHLRPAHRASRGSFEDHPTRA